MFTRISYDDYIFSTWRSHYHALCHGISPIWLKNEIMEGRSITICNLDHNFYSSAIVGGVLPIALGVSIGLKRKNSKQKVWCFVGDMTFETGIFYEMYKYATNFNLPLHSHLVISIYHPGQMKGKLKFFEQMKGKLKIFGRFAARNP